MSTPNTTPDTTADTTPDTVPAPSPANAPITAVRRLARPFTGRLRRGSVLILVVALVVLLALMGTAYLSSTQGERQTAAQHQANAQIDLALQSASAQLQQAIVRDLFDQSQPTPGGYRPADADAYRTPANLRAVASIGPPAIVPVPITTTYHNWDSEQTQLWLGSRIPDLRDNTFPYADTGGANDTAATAGGNLAGYDALSWPLVPSPDPTTGGLNYAYYDPRTGKPVLSVGTIYSPAATYVANDIVSDGPPTNRFFVAVQGSGPSSVHAPSNALSTAGPDYLTYWMPLDMEPQPTGLQTFQPKQNRRYEPTAQTVNGTVYPAFRVFNTQGAAGSAYTAPITTGVTQPAGAAPTDVMIAADADGDGVADAGYWPLPGGAVNGVRYYGAVRVVDNAAALNAATARDMTSDFAATDVRYGSGTTAVGYNFGLFPSNVGLQELMFDYGSTTPDAQSADYLRVVSYWCHTTAAYDDYTQPPQADALNAVSSPTARTDYAFLTQGDQFWSQIARRLENPGLKSTGASTTPFQPLTQADGLSLASRFVLAPYDRSTTGALEPLLPELTSFYALNTSVGALPSPVPAVPNVPYSPALTGAVSPQNGTYGWFDANFNFNADLSRATNPGTNSRSLRAQIVTRNGVSNRAGGLTMPAYVGAQLNTAATYAKYADVINPGMTPYNAPVAYPRDGQTTSLVTGTPEVGYLAGQFIRFLTPSGDWRTFRCLQGTTATPTKLTVHSPYDPRRTDAFNPYVTPDQYWAVESTAPAATKASVNTATFPELWRSFYNVMADGWNTAPMTPTGTAVGQAMFKSSIRTGTGQAAAPPSGATVPTTLSDIQMVQLRAALAGVNAMALRDPSDNVVSRNVALYVDPDPSKGTAPITAEAANRVSATVFGGEKQPFITKVVVVNREKGGLPPFVAVELYNPYVQLQYPGGELPPTNGNDVAFYMGTAATTPYTKLTGSTARPIFLGCRLGILKRGAGAVTVTEAVDPKTGLVNNATLWSGCPAIQPGKYLTLVSDATNVPPSISLHTAASSVDSATFAVPALASLVTPPPAAGGVPPTAPDPAELVLYRTRNATDGSPRDSTAPKDYKGTSEAKTSAAYDPTQVYDESVLTQMCPFDQFDLTNNTDLVNTDNDGLPFVYYRPTQVTTTAPTPATAQDYWKCVYPLKPTGVYTPGTFAEPSVPPTAGAPVGTGEPIVPVTSPLLGTYSDTNPFPLGQGFNGAAVVPPVPAAWHKIQINNVDWPAPHTVASGTGTVNVYPVAGFARLGDLLQVPFIGSYTLANAPLDNALDTTVPAPTSLFEVNSVTMDALFAEDRLVYGTAADAPATADDPTTVAPAAGALLEQVGRFCPLTATASPLAGITPDTDRYAWASRLFDAFTIHAPHDDYMPNADPATYTASLSTPPSVVKIPVPVPNTLGTPAYQANATEDDVPVQGLVNINTASWRTLSMIPWVRYAQDSTYTRDGTVNVEASARMAMAIVAYRRVHGPFKSILDLNKVVNPALATQTFQGADNFGVGDPGVTVTSGETITFDGGKVANASDTTGKYVSSDPRQGLLTPNDINNNPYPLFSVGKPTFNYPPNAGVYDDFQTKFLALTRVSNLITTRSDSFTCYVLVEGWRDSDHTMVSRKRSAFVLDRAPVGYSVNPTTGTRQLNTSPVVTPISTGE